MISARQIAWEISNGIRPSQFIGKKSPEVLTQELFSLKNRYHPETMTRYELSRWEKDLCAVIEATLKLEKEQRAEIYSKVDDMLQLNLF